MGSGLPSFTETSTITKIIRGWLDDDMRINPIETEKLLPNDSSCCIILRHHGEVIGVGTAGVLSSNPIAECAHLAFEEVMQNKILRRLAPEMRSFALSSLSIELEIADAPEPSPIKNLNRFAQGLQSGVVGVGVRKGNSWAIRLPAELRLSPIQNTVIALESLCIEVGVHPATALSRQIPQQDDVTMYTIPTITVVQDQSRGQVRKLVRGDELVAITEIHPNTMNLVADLIASHLITCLNNDGFVIGGYQPETDSLSPPHATVFVHVLVAAALDVYASNAQALHRDDAIKTMNTILLTVSNQYKDGNSISNSVASAMVILSVPNESIANQFPDFLSRCKQQVINSCKHLVNEGETALRPHEFAMLADAIATISISNKEDADINTLANEVCLMCMKEVPLKSKMSTIPWIVDAQYKLAIDAAEQPAMQELLQIALSAQIHEKDSDLLGGFSLVSGGTKIVDARGIRIVPMLAQFSQTPNPNQSKAIRALTKAIRFVVQLTTREQRTHRFINPTLSKGGVRVATWDASMPTEASAMALFGISRAIEAFRVASKGN